jgi:hypothetical protein
LRESFEKKAKIKKDGPTGSLNVSQNESAIATAFVSIQKKRRMASRIM